jgi:putative methionine-R-sulfoxide reductase with GAF domain
MLLDGRLIGVLDVDSDRLDDFDDVDVAGLEAIVGVVCANGEWG